MRRFVVGLCVFVGVLLLARVAWAQNGTPPTSNPVTPDDVNRVARQLYCPVCENEPLDACRTSACQQWRAQIAQLLSEGQTDQQVIQYFVDRYGLRVLGTPPPSGTTLLLWALPIVGLVIGGAYVIVLIRRMRARSGVTSTPAPQPPGSDDYVQRVERDLKKW